MTDKYIEKWGEVWVQDDPKMIELQYKMECCGFENYTDRAVEACPIDFESGCSRLMRSFMSARLKEIFIGFLVVLCTTVVSVVMLMIWIHIVDEPGNGSILENCYVIGSVLALD
jgi:hypothetical protein